MVTLCKARRADGSPCTLRPRPGRRVCWVHDPELADARAEGRRRGGLNRRPAPPPPPDQPDPPLETVADVGRFLKAAMLDVRAGRMAESVGYCLGSLAGVLVKVLEVGELEERLAALETARTPRRAA